MDLTLHIGSGKTGTTYLQQTLAESRPRLAQAGWLYPVSPGRARHVRISLWAKTDLQLERDPAWHHQRGTEPERMRRRLVRRLGAEIRDGGTSRVLISDEGLYGMPNDAVTRLRGLTDRLARTVRIVVYLRRQDEHLISRYQQAVKTGQMLTLSAWSAMNMAKTYDYRARLELWNRALEPELLTVRPFEKSRFHGGSLLHDFLDAAAVDVPAEEMTVGERRNESLDAESVEFVRLVNLFRHEVEGLPMAKIDNRWMLPALMAASQGPALSLPTEELRQFMARWAESNRAVAADFLDTTDLFDDAPPGRETTTDQRLDPLRLDYYFELVTVPEPWRESLRAIAERESSRHHRD